MSGFWVSTLFLLLPLDSAKPLIVAGTLLFWIGHRIASVYLAVCVREYREVLQARRRYFFAFPLCLLCLLGVFLLVPEEVMGLSLFRRFILLAFLDYFLSLYHFASQHYGVLSVYRGRLPHGQRDSGLLRWDWWVCIGVSGIFSIVFDYFNGQFDDFGIFDNAPLVSESTVDGLRTALALLVVVAWGLTMRKYAQKRQGIARMLYFTTLCYMTIVSFYLAPVLYFFVVQTQHWLVSLGLTAHMATNSRFEPQKQSNAFWYGTWAWINARALGPLSVLVLLSICLTPILEADYFITNGFDRETLTVQGFLIQFEDTVWIYVFGGVAIFTAFVHYIYDRGVFRFSDPLIRKAALPLLQPPAGTEGN
ncbi:MAG TPA: hypothetical protein VFR18_27450 [Terriglobia bacterium]|nr:hypothetical protein [Terriglobia bacterium]